MKAQQSPQAILLKKNDPAPYAGILAPVNYIKNLEADSERAKLYKLEIEKNKDCLPELSAFEPPSNDSSFWLGAGIGLSIGTILSIVLIHH